MDDVAIVGAGPAGSLAALLLARAGFRVRLFDRARFPRAKLCGDTLNPGACAALASHLPLAPLLARSYPLVGMLLTGPGGVAVRGAYGEGRCGYAVERRVFDQWLLERALEVGVALEEHCLVTEPTLIDRRVSGIKIRRDGGVVAHPARLVIAADGRHSRLAFALGLSRHAPQPRRWAIGAYFERVEDLSALGEMHVRRGYYVGVAPMPDGRANACLVLPYRRGDGAWRDARQLLLAHLAADPALGARFARARMAGDPVVLGPMAVDASSAGMPGLLLAGDAAGFVDPMTGDGLTFALRGAELAAAIACDVLNGTLAPDAAPRALLQCRRSAFGRKLRFNKILRRLVSSPAAVLTAASAARLSPRAFTALIRYAGDASHAAPRRYP